MTLKHIVLFGVMVILMTISVSANSYQVNESIRIDALYTEGGILTDSTANISIYTPSSTLSVSNVGMNSSSTGIFFYDYLIPNEEGRYTVIVRFYVNDTLSGLKTGYFQVGEDKLSFGVCPSGDTLTYLIILLIVLFVLFLLDALLHVPYLSAISGLFMIFTSLYFFPCSFMFGMVILAAGLIMTIYGVTKKL